ncbi:MAG: heavy metal translocating P-type ATPase [Anaerolineae bacterium]
MTHPQRFQIGGMDCAECAQKIEATVGAVDGVTRCRVNFATAGLKVESSAPIDPQRIIRRVQSLGYDAVRAGEIQPPQTALRQLQTLVARPRNLLTLAGVVLIGAAFGLEAAGRGAGGGFPFEVAAQTLFLMGGLMGLYFPAKSGWAAIRNGQGLDINVLMTIAAASAFAIGEVAEAATVIVLFSLGEALEGYTMDRARNSIRSLTELAPRRATRLAPRLNCQRHRGRPLPGGTGVYGAGPCPWCAPHEQDVPVETLAIGDRIVVKPGQRIPMDGRVLAGESAVNQAPITGESMPVDKPAGAEVFAGSINGNGALEIEINRLAADNTLSRLIYLVEAAQAQKTPAQRFVDSFARIYTPAVVAGAVLVALVPPLAFGGPFLNTPTQYGWLYRALTLLVIACPCALVIATPVAVVSAISTAARQGVLIKGGAYLEALGRLKVVAFDKTGTLTRGRPSVVATHCIDNCCAEARRLNPNAPCPHCDDMLALAAALERRSDHPLAQAITASAEARALPQLNAERIENLPGHGIRGWVNNRPVTVGSHALLHNNSPTLADFCRRIAQTEASGLTTILVGQEDALCGYLSVSDSLRPAAQTALAELKRAGISHTVMLTGDNPAVARRIAAHLGLTEVRANLLPQHKIEAVKALHRRYGPAVAMVGDGVNDAPALAAAGVGIAMGAGGSAQALEAAGVALMADDLVQLPFAVRLGRRATRTIRVNIWLALAIKGIFLLAALAGVATLWMAVFADVGASLLVTLNGMRLLRQT